MGPFFVFIYYFQELRKVKLLMSPAFDTTFKSDS